MTWNHRIVRTVSKNGEEYFELAEVFYDTEGTPYAYGDATISSEKFDELLVQVDWFKKSLDMPILEYPEHFTGDVNK